MHRCLAADPVNPDLQNGWFACHSRLDRQSLDDLVLIWGLILWHYFGPVPSPRPCLILETLGSMWLHSYSAQFALLKYWRRFLAGEMTEGCAEQLNCCQGSSRVGCLPALAGPGL